MQSTLNKLARIDLMFGLSALIVLASGLIQWFVVGKDATFYSRNWIFHVKLTMFVLMAVLSILPTVYFLKNRNKGNENDEITIPGRIRVIIMIENTLMFIIPLVGILMSRGIGSF